MLPRLLKFVEQLTNWYVRMNRKRLKGELGVEDCTKSLETLYGVLLTITRVMVRTTMAGLMFGGDLFH